MANQWFKLYGVEMISDPKYQRLNAGERSCWITLLCLASIDDGIVKHVEEPYLIVQSGVDPMEMGKVQGIISKLEMLGMITRERDEIGIGYIKIKNWEKRQEVYSESRERVAKWRENKKNKEVSEDVTPVTLPSNGKNRIDKNRIEEIREEDTDVAIAPLPSPKKFQKPKIEEVKAYCDERSNGIDPQAFIDYYESNGWKVGKNSMKDWKASVRTWERNGYSKNKTSTTTTTNLDDPNVMAELNKKYK